MAAPRIEATEVCAGYARADVLHHVSLRLLPGEMAGLIGPNGCGKSTLLRVLAGILPLRAGEVRIDGEPARELSPRELARRIAFVPQSETRLFEFTVRDVALMGRHPHIRPGRSPGPGDFAAASRAMADLDILHLAERAITSLSGGEHRRTLVARAFAQETSTLLLDEPTAHLDITHQAEVLSLLRARAESSGLASLAALHDLNLAAEFCHRLILLNEGRVEADGPPQDVLRVLLLERVYGAGLQVLRRPDSTLPLVLPSPAIHAGPCESERVHVICGGGSGAALLAFLRRRGYRVTAGVLNRLDSDESACSALGIEQIVEEPFSPIGASAREACRRAIESASAVVVADIAIGRGNLANLELAAVAIECGTPTFLLAPTPVAARDFTGGAGARLWDSLERAGARAVESLAELDELLRLLSTSAPGTLPAG